MTDVEFKNYVIRKGLLPAWISTCQKLKKWKVRTTPKEFRKNLAPFRVHEFFTLKNMDPLYVKHLDRIIQVKLHVVAPFRILPDAADPWEAWKRFGLHGMGY